MSQEYAGRGVAWFNHYGGDARAVSPTRSPSCTYIPSDDCQKWSPKFGQGCKVEFALMRGPDDDGEATQFFT